MSVANSYAKALYFSAAEGKSPTDIARTCGQIESELDAVITAIEASREARVALFGPVMTTKEKADVISAVAAKAGTEKLVGQFLRLLASKGRLSILREIREEFTIVKLHAEGGLSGVLASAEPMSDADIESLAQAFTKKMGRKVVFRTTVDPTLLAGVKVTVSGVTYDGTLRSQLQQLKDRVLVAHTS